METRRAPRLAACAFLALAIALGAALRLANLAGQVLGGDELHAVRAALAQPLSALLTTYQLADSCIPLTALDRLLVEHGLPLDERRLRLPVLACGLAALALLPALARRHLSPAALPLFAALVAISPLLVLYSRIARSYMPATLLSFAAVMSFDAWWRPPPPSHERAPRRRTLALAAYVLCGALAIWFHLGTAPIVAAPLLFGFADLGLGRRRAADEFPAAALGALLAAGAALAVACALFVLPALPSLLRLVAAKHQAQSVPAATWWGVLRLQAGTAQLAPMAAFWAAAAAGAISLVRRRPRLGWYLLTLVVAQPAGILVLSPLGLARLQVLDRYLLPALPVVLLLVAAGLARPWWPRQSRAGAVAQRVAAGGLVLLWLAAGPFADPGYRASSFMHHNDLVAFALLRATLPPGGLPAPYRVLGGPPGSAVVELPWPPAWDFGRSFYVYQEVHGLRVLVAPLPGALPADPERLRLRNAVAPLPAALLASGARWVVVHRGLAAEEDRLVLPPGSPPPRRMPPALAAQLAAVGERAIARLTAAWGPPAAADAAVAVWSLRRAGRGPLHYDRRP